jgi:sortase A
MSKVYYKKNGVVDKRKVLRLFSVLLFLSGVLMVGYIFLPLLSWQIYFAPVFADQSIAAPIPKNTVVSGSTIASLIQEASNTISGIDYTNADNWFPTYKTTGNSAPRISTFTISIPKLKIKNAVVSTVDNDLAKHLVNYGGTAIPPDKGNAVIFGHSTLPQLFEDGNYKTIFTYLYQLSPGDQIIVNTGGSVFKYDIESMTVVDPDNTSVLEQNYNDSYLTLVTCTPPGTIWKRLVLKAKLAKI